MTREERLQLNAKSKLLTGKSGTWIKAMSQGAVVPMEETLEDGTIRKYRGIKYPTLEEVKKNMEEALVEKLKKDKEEEERKAKVAKEEKK